MSLQIFNPNADRSTLKNIPMYNCNADENLNFWRKFQSNVQTVWVHREWGLIRCEDELELEFQVVAANKDSILYLCHPRPTLNSQHQWFPSISIICVGILSYVNIQTYWTFSGDTLLTLSYTLVGCNAYLHIQTQTRFLCSLTLCGISHINHETLKG